MGTDGVGHCAGAYIECGENRAKSRAKPSREILAQTEGNVAAGVLKNFGNRGDHLT
jgi:hypothetical protein